MTEKGERCPNCGAEDACLYATAPVVGGVVGVVHCGCFWDDPPKGVRRHFGNTPLQEESPKKEESPLQRMKLRVADIVGVRQNGKAITILLRSGVASTVIARDEKNATEVFDRLSGLLDQGGGLTALFD